jgi:outer membrane protein assembly factor BamB
MIRPILVASLCAACGMPASSAVPWERPGDRDVGRPVLAFLWKKTIIDHRFDHKPQEFASPLAAPIGSGDGTVYVGSHNGLFVALRARDGRRVWTQKLGSVSAEPLVDGTTVYVGTDAGEMYALDALTGTVKWQYASKGQVLRAPTPVGDMLVFASDADRVVAVDRATGKYRWQYERDTPEEFTLHGHAGVAAAKDRLYAGFGDGHVVALTPAAGEVAWVRSLAGEQRTFVDVDTTPLPHDGVLFAASSSGGLYALDVADGTEKWHAPGVKGVSHLTLDGGRLYAAAAETGLFVLDLDGHILWRQGMIGAGDPARPIVDGMYLFLATSERGLYIIDKRDGALIESFNPGNGISAVPAFDGGNVYFLSNGGILYAMNVRRF